jgi:hypothetical protein
MVDMWLRYGMISYDAGKVIKVAHYTGSTAFSSEKQQITIMSDRIAQYEGKRKTFESRDAIDIFSKEETGQVVSSSCHSLIGDLPKATSECSLNTGGRSEGTTYDWCGFSEALGA